VHAAIAFAAAGDLKRAATELQEAIRLDPSVQKRPDVMALQQSLAGKRQ
jgi:Tfp pilus assembly protein PilF